MSDGLVLNELRLLMKLYWMLWLFSFSVLSSGMEWVLLVRAMRWFNGCGSRVARLKRPWHPDCMLCVCGYNRNNAPSPLRVDKHSQRHSSRLAFVFIPVLFVFELHSLLQWITVCTAASRCLSLTVWLHCAANNGTWSGPNIQISNWWRDDHDDDAQWYALCGSPFPFLYRWHIVWELGFYWSD